MKCAGFFKQCSNEALLPVDLLGMRVRICRSCWDMMRERYGMAEHPELNGVIELGTRKEIESLLKFYFGRYSVYESLGVLMFRVSFRTYRASAYPIILKELKKIAGVGVQVDYAFRLSWYENLFRRRRWFQFCEVVNGYAEVRSR